ncbi:hypothetical protein DPMN_139462 [Dreissena polymorpha]|uniref:Uncharacterized protein n=1 Tax=Dreissena polymorpha TaxID=45954 RepID=A0A9D4G5S2_DREPO|nr:hypothetical protein DPMN_139462 [Dreissena polymorpha]
MGRGFQRGRGLEKGRGRHQAKYARKKNIYNKYDGFQRARGRGISERDRGKNQAKYVGGKSDTSLMHKGITQHDRPLNCYTDLDMPVDEPENTLEDIRIGNPRLTHEVELERRTEEQQHERSVYNGQRTELRGKRVNKQNQTHERRTDYQRDAVSCKL